ncbi:MAG: hypothetical protein HY427_00020 [Candidatus Levybacteria bacterium]|nr:hypothetical protein [Candidatus Levybacteria bacterium]
MTENIDRTVKDSNATGFWASVGFKVREGMRMHKLTGQLEKGPDSWRNVTEHCLVQTARSEILGRWIGLPEDLIRDMRMGAILHDFDKKEEMAVIRQANQIGASPLSPVRSEGKIADDLLRTSGFSDRVIRLADSSGVDAPQLIEAQRILDQESLSDEDLAWLVVHYVDDCSIGTDWVLSSQEGRNIVDFRMGQNKSKADYVKISQEIAQELANHPKFRGMNIYDAAVSVDRQIERRFAQRIKGITGDDVDPLTVPELVDQKIRESIEEFPKSS